MPRATPFAFDEFWRGLNKDQRQAFAKNAKSTVAYLGGHVMYGRRLPGIATIENLATACNKAGKPVTPEELLVWFYQRGRSKRLQAVKSRRRRPLLAVANG